MAGKIIGIPGWKTGDNSFGCSTPYIEYLRCYGRIRIIMPEDPIITNLDLLVIPGGPDIDPIRYGAIPSFNTSKPDPLREYFDQVVLPEYIEAGIPMFGICRGMQSICVHFGAKLIQDMYHETSIQERSDLVHEVLLTVRGDEILSHFGKAKVKVNSLHHQCVSKEGFPDELEVLGIYKGKYHDACIEIIRHRTLPIFGVQYHPEELIYDSISDAIVKKLLTKVEIYA